MNMADMLNETVKYFIAQNEKPSGQSKGNYLGYLVGTMSVSTSLDTVQIIWAETKEHTQSISNDNEDGREKLLVN